MFAVGFVGWDFVNSYVAGEHVCVGTCGAIVAVFVNRANYFGNLNRRLCKSSRIASEAGVREMAL